MACACNRKMNNLIVSNAGDCHVVMCQGGPTEAPTVPLRKMKKIRVEDMAGYVDCLNGVWRILLQIIANLPTLMRVPLAMYPPSILQQVSYTPLQLLTKPSCAAT
ncbi:protein phosphatase 2C 2 [Artemisia annua]|uniref:Protein phosphatase 2C 2 n=1 Tax=Artemisia annua TaxID=35608 RepID=A0A2U1KZJ9_ARTAN|nr:protein phosphatase 2C 2 [Artemisia annua]